MIEHPDPTKFIANSGDYGALGKTLIALSNLEFFHDNFVFKVRDTNPELATALSKRFPRHFKEKTNFLINAVSCIPKLKQIPIFSSGELNLLWLQYQLDEIYEVRSIVAHGSVFFTQTTPNRIIWTFERYVQKRDRSWTRTAVKISNGYLASVHISAETVRQYIARLTRCLEDGSCWEIDYQEHKVIRRNRKFLAELVDSGTVIDDKGWIGAFKPLGPIE